MKIDSTWKEKFKTRGILVQEILYPKEIKNTWLCVTNCTRKKQKTNKAVVPKDLYTSTIFSKFVQFCECHCIPYAILSDLYGLCFQNEKINSYDLAPNEVKDRDGLAQLINSKMNTKCPSKDTIVYYRSSPVFAWTYLDILLRTNFKIIFVLKLRNKKPSPGFNLLKG